MRPEQAHQTVAIVPMDLNAELGVHLLRQYVLLVSTEPCLRAMFATNVQKEAQVLKEGLEIHWNAISVLLEEFVIMMASLMYHSQFPVLMVKFVILALALLIS